MGLLAWIVVGLVAGWLANLATRSPSRGCITTGLIGVLGGVIGGILFNAAGEKGMTDFGLWSIFVAFVGATLLLLLLQLVQRR